MIKNPPKIEDSSKKINAVVVHEENDWGISLVSESEPIAGADSNSVASPPGLRFEYDRPIQHSTADSGDVAPKDTESLEDLMSRMKSL